MTERLFSKTLWCAPDAIQLCWRFVFIQARCRRRVTREREKMGGDEFGFLSTLIYTCLRNSPSFTGCLRGFGWDAAFYGCATRKDYKEFRKSLDFNAEQHSLCWNYDNGRLHLSNKLAVTPKSTFPLGLNAESRWCKNAFWWAETWLFQSKSVPSKKLAEPNGPRTT